MSNEMPITGNRKHGAVTMIATGWLLAAPVVLTAAEPVMTAVLVRCGDGPITKTFGKTEWLVNACSDGMLMLSPAPSNSASHPFTFRFNEPGDPFASDRFRDERAKAAYRELRKLTSEQVDALVREVRASTQDPQGNK